MDLVHEQHGVGQAFDLLEHGFDAVLEITAEAGAGDQRAHVERVDHDVGKRRRDVLGHDLRGQAFDDRGLADAGVAHEHGVVLAATAQHLDRAPQLFLAADQRLDVAGLGLLVQVDRELGERIGGRRRVAVFVVVARAFAGGERVFVVAVFADAVGDEVHQIITGEPGFGQRGDRGRIELAEDRDQDVVPFELFFAAVLHVDRGAAEHPLKATRGAQIELLRLGHAAHFLVEEAIERALELVDVTAGGLGGAGRGGILEQAVEQVLHGHDVVTTTDGFTLRERAGCFDFSADFHSSDPPKPSGSAVHLSG